MKHTLFAVVTVVIRLAALGLMIWGVLTFLSVLLTSVLMSGMGMMPIMFFAAGIQCLGGAVLWVISRSLADLVTRDLE